MALTPIALIPQVVLGGLMVPMTTNPMLKPLMYVMPARWGFEGAIAQERAAIVVEPGVGHRSEPADAEQPRRLRHGGHFQCAIAADRERHDLPGAWGFIEWNQPWRAASPCCSG